MRTARYGGFEIELGGIVWIFDIWAARPVFHRADFTGELGAMWLKTGCGEPVESERRRGTAGTAVALPPKHAVRIGRPCATCWPQLRAQPSLFTRPRSTRDTTTQEPLQ